MASCIRSYSSPRASKTALVLLVIYSPSLWTLLEEWTPFLQKIVPHLVFSGYCWTHQSKISYRCSVWWDLWRLSMSWHRIHISSILIKPFSDSLCLGWKYLHLLCFLSHLLYKLSISYLITVWPCRTCCAFTVRVMFLLLGWLLFHFYFLIFKSICCCNVLVRSLWLTHLPSPAKKKAKIRGVWITGRCCADMPLKPGSH